MGRDTKIEWAHHSWSPWRGCTKVSEGCRHCYAAAGSLRNPAVLGVWGPEGTRVVAAESAWREPLGWKKEGWGAEYLRVFPSLCDPFEDWRGPMQDHRGVQWWKRGDGSWTTSDHYPDTVALTMDDVRRRLFRLMIDTYGDLTWLLLTKRPTLIKPLLSRLEGYALSNLWDEVNCYPDCWNAWWGVSVEDQPAAEARLPFLAELSGLLWVSAEPLLGPLDLRPWLRRLAWVVVGGESGSRHRPMEPAWLASVVAQCQGEGVACFVKQDSHRFPGQQGRIPEELWAVKEFPG